MIDKISLSIKNQKINFFVGCFYFFCLKVKPRLTPTKNAAMTATFSIGRRDRIRTDDPYVPNVVLYQAEPPSENAPIISNLSEKRKAFYTPLLFLP